MWSLSSCSDDYTTCSDGLSEHNSDRLQNINLEEDLKLSLIISQSLTDTLMELPTNYPDPEASLPSKGFGNFMRKASKKFIPERRSKESKVSRQYQSATTSDIGSDIVTMNFCTEIGNPLGKTSGNSIQSLSLYDTNSQKTDIQVPRSFSFNAKKSADREKPPESLTISAGNSRQSTPCPNSLDPTMSPNMPNTSVVSTSLDVASQTSQSRGFVKNFTSTISRQLSFKRNRPRSSIELNGVLSSPQSPVCYKELLKLFECPGCFLLMIPPFYQCRKGHLVCDKCKVALKVTCPKCKQRITDETNGMMVQVCNLINFPCRFNRYGCCEFYRPAQKADHENFCSYRPVHCHYYSHGCQKILTVRDMNIHVAECTFKEFQD